MDLVIKDEVYKIKVGAEVYSVQYPSFDEAIKISKAFQAPEIVNDGEKSIKLMKKWLIELGLDEKFFSLKAIKSKHIFQLWTELNSVKK